MTMELTEQSSNKSAGSTTRDKKRKKKLYYIKAAKKQKTRHLKLQPGLKGFLCTCNNKERECIREAYILLNEYADNMYGPEHIQVAENGGSTSLERSDSSDSIDEVEESEEEIEDALEREVTALKAQAKKPLQERRFQLVNTGAKNCLFIKTMVEEPAEIVRRIVSDISSAQKQKTRYLLRLLPVEVTSKAYESDIKKAAEDLFNKYFREEGKSFAVICRVRHNNQVKKEEVMLMLSDLVKEKHPLNRVELKTPQLAVMVEVIAGTCCLSVIPDYYSFRKYNLVELAQGVAPHKRKESQGVETDKVTIQQVTASEELENISTSQIRKEVEISGVGNSTVTAVQCKDEGVSELYQVTDSKIDLEQTKGAVKEHSENVNEEMCVQNVKDRGTE